MSKVLSTIGALTLIVLAAYGCVKLISAAVGLFQGQEVAKVAEPVVKDVASSVADSIKQTLKETPDSRLEEESEILSRKLYFITKGALKGQMGAIVKDTEGPDIRDKMHQAGKNVSQNLVTPFTKGLAEGTTSSLKDLQQVVGGVRQFLDENRDLVNAVAEGIKELRRNLEHNAPLTPRFQQSQPMLPPPFLGKSGRTEPLTPYHR
jgi:hypothetical protein